MFNRLGFNNQNERKETEKKVSILKKLRSSMKQSKNESEQKFRPKTAATGILRSILSPESNNRSKTSHQRKKPENKSVTFEESFNCRTLSPKFIPMLETIYEDYPVQQVNVKTDRMKNIEISQKQIEQEQKIDKKSHESKGQRAVTDIIRDFEMREKIASKRRVK